MRNVLPAVLNALHYHSDCDGLVVVVDSDLSRVHQVSHPAQGQTAAKCRLCELRAVAHDVLGNLRPRQGRGPLKVAIGLAVPAIEAWYLAGIRPQVTESAWIVGIQSRRPPFTTNQLKEMVYGTDRPSLALETQFAERAARRLVDSDGLDLLEKLFPGGFGALAGDVRGW